MKVVGIADSVISAVQSGKTLEQALSTVNRDEAEIEVVAAAEACYESVTGVYAAILAAKAKKNENYGAFIYNYLTNYELFINDGAAIAKAIESGDYFSAGQLYGTLFQTAIGYNISEIEPILESGEAQYTSQVEGSGNVTGIPVFLQNATLFMEGFGSGFDLSDDTNDIYVAEADLYTIYQDAQVLVKDIAKGASIATIVADINQMWGDFTTAFTDCNTALTNLATVFNPAIQMAKSNTTELENTFKANLAKHPLQSAVLAAKFKLEWSADNFFAAGDSWAQITEIGLNGLYNMTSN
jgi:hypothetical protein